MLRENTKKRSPKDKAEPAQECHYTQNDSGSLVHSIIDEMRECKEITLKIAEELGFEHKGEPTAKQIKAYLENVSMDIDDYALANKIGGKLSHCLSIIEQLSVTEDTKTEARELASFAYETVGV